MLVYDRVVWDAQIKGTGFEARSMREDRGKEVINVLAELGQVDIDQFAEELEEGVGRDFLGEGKHIFT